MRKPEQTKPVVALSKKLYNPQLDMLKGFAILLVVLGHATQTYASNGNFDNNLLFRIIYSFHMPLFMFLSGAVAAYSSRPMNFDFIKRKFYQLVVPFIAWYLLGYYLFSTYHHIHFSTYIHRVIVSPDYGLWFLWVLFLNFCALALIKYLSSWLKLWSYLIVWLAIYMIPTGKYGIGLVKWHLPFFIIGYLIFAYREHLVRYRKFAFTLSIVAFPVLVSSWHRLYDPSFVTGLGPRLAHHHLSDLTVGDLATVHTYPIADLFYKYLVAFSGIGFVYYLLLLKPNRYIYSILSFLGLYTLDIYVSHQLLLQYRFGTSWMAIGTSFIFATALSLALGYLLLRRVTLLSIIFLGGRTKPASLSLKKK